MTAMDADDARAHLEHKANARELRGAVLERMRAALAGASGPVDWAALLEAATFPPFAGGPLFHTADAAVREAVVSHGLRRGDLRNWQRHRDWVSSQPEGVYAGTSPDESGVWSHWSRWDVWRIDTAGLSVEVDRLNPGCYRICGDVPAGAVTLHGTYSY